jgi:hypothetical protein
MIGTNEIPRKPRIFRRLIYEMIIDSGVFGAVLLMVRLFGEGQVNILFFLNDVEGNGNVTVIENFKK